MQTLMNKIKRNSDPPLPLISMFDDIQILAGSPSEETLLTQLKTTDMDV
jgi:hypothetical protein